MPIEHLLEGRNELLNLPVIRGTFATLEMIMASYACKYFWLNSSGINPWLEEVTSFVEINSPENYPKMVGYKKWLSALPFPVDAAYFYVWAYPKIKQIALNAQENQCKA